MPVMDSRLNRNKMECGRMFADLWMKRRFNVYSSLVIWPDKRKWGQWKCLLLIWKWVRCTSLWFSVVSRSWFILLSERLLGLAAGNPSDLAPSWLNSLPWTSRRGPAHRPSSRKEPMWRSWALLSPDLSAVLCNLCLIWKLKAVWWIISD